jgi:hypothetical protein
VEKPRDANEEASRTGRNCLEGLSYQSSESLQRGEQVGASPIGRYIRGGDLFSSLAILATLYSSLIPGAASEQSNDEVFLIIQVVMDHQFRHFLSKWVDKFFSNESDEKNCIGSTRDSLEGKLKLYLIPEDRSRKSRDSTGLTGD